MISVNYCQTMAKYNQWQNDNLINAIADQDEEIWQKNHRVFFHSLQGTLNHLIYGDMVWLDRFSGSPVRFTDPKIILAPSITKWINCRRNLDEEIINWFDLISDQWLQEDYKFYSYVYNREIIKPWWLFVSHFFNHQTHHRSQATTILNQLGVAYGVTDLPWLPENY